MNSQNKFEGSIQQELGLTEERSEQLRELAEAIYTNTESEKDAILKIEDCVYKDPFNLGISINVHEAVLIGWKLGQFYEIQSSPVLGVLEMIKQGEL